VATGGSERSTGAARTASTASANGRRFGDLLVEEKLITPAQLDMALRLQARARVYLPLGQVLVAEKVITRKQLTALLHRHRKRSRLGQILVRAGCIIEAQLNDALAQQSRMRLPLGRALIQLGYLSEPMLRDALCTQLHINFFDLDPIDFDRELARLISERYATRHLIVPVFRAGQVLVIAMDDPTRAALIEELQGSLGLHIEVVTATTQSLKNALGRLYATAPPARSAVATQRNILIGPVRDPVVAELASQALRGVRLLPPGWQ
jgi:Type II secretion system (T2SS), protein E, N-terminal domain